MEKGILGIDPGLGGAAVLISKDNIILYKFTMPIIENILDIPELNRRLGNIKENVGHTYMEYVASRPLMSSQSVFKFGRVYGITEALLVVNSLSYTLVTPKRWTSVVLEGIEKMNNPKDRNRIAISRLFPDEDFRATERCKVPHSGMVDACLIALYGMRTQSGITQRNRKAV